MKRNFSDQQPAYNDDYIFNQNTLHPLDPGDDFFKPVFTCSSIKQNLLPEFKKRENLTRLCGAMEKEKKEESITKNSKFTKD